MGPGTLPARGREIRAGSRHRPSRSPRPRAPSSVVFIATGEARDETRWRIESNGHRAERPPLHLDQTVGGAVAAAPQKHSPPRRPTARASIVDCLLRIWVANLLELGRTAESVEAEARPASRCRSQLLTAPRDDDCRDQRGRAGDRPRDTARPRLPRRPRARERAPGHDCRGRGLPRTSSGGAHYDWRNSRVAERIHLDELLAAIRPAGRDRAGCARGLPGGAFDFKTKPRGSLGRLEAARGADIAALPRRCAARHGLEHGDRRRGRPRRRRRGRERVPV